MAASDTKKHKPVPGSPDSNFAPKITLFRHFGEKTAGNKTGVTIWSPLHTYCRVPEGTESLDLNSVGYMSNIAFSGGRGLWSPPAYCREQEGTGSQVEVA